MSMLLRRFSQPVLLCMTISMTAGLWAEEPTRGVLFEFKLDTADVLIVDKYQDIRIFNGQSYETREEKNRIVLKVSTKSPRYARLQGTFLTYSRAPRRVGQFREDRRFFSDFAIQADGKYLVTDRFIMPNLRSMPRFPTESIMPGHQWHLPAEELISLAGQNFKMPVQVDYHYAGRQEIKIPGKGKRLLDRIEYKYTFNHPVQKAGSVLQRVTGFGTCVLWFDRTRGIPLYDSSRLVYDFQLSDGSHREFLFRIESLYEKRKTISEDDKNLIVDQIKKDLGKDQDLKVRKTKEGIVLEMADILFAHNRAGLNQRAESQLKRIASILKQYPNREIRISGHTDSSGSKVYNQNLSASRARNVLQELQNKNGIEGRRMSYKGYGESQPVSDNTSPEGRASNRRVEVLIVTE